MHHRRSRRRGRHVGSIRGRRVAVGLVRSRRRASPGRGRSHDRDRRPRPRTVGHRQRPGQRAEHDGAVGPSSVRTQGVRPDQVRFSGRLRDALAPGPRTSTSTSNKFTIVAAGGTASISRRLTNRWRSPVVCAVHKPRSTIAIPRRHDGASTGRAAEFDEPGRESRAPSVREGRRWLRQHRYGESSGLAGEVDAIALVTLPPASTSRRNRFGRVIVGVPRPNVSPSSTAWCSRRTVL